jgi:HKD family nuclease
MSGKNKRKKEVNKSTNYIFENKEKREIQVGLKSIKIDDDIFKKKEESDSKRNERSSKSIKKKKNRSITNHLHKIDDDTIRAEIHVYIIQKRNWIVVMQQVVHIH